MSRWKNTFLLTVRMVDRKLGKRLVSRRRNKRSKTWSKIGLIWTKTNSQNMNRRRSKSKGSGGPRSKMITCVRGRKPS